MLNLECDYLAGAHPEILQKFIETNMETTPGYGSDEYTYRAYEAIKKACNCPEAQIYFTMGGTQTNLLVISTMLRDYEGVVAATTGHVSLHEAGAIEHSGHKVLNIPGHMGKIDADELGDYLNTCMFDENREHMVFPGMVYISYPTEYGSIYSKEELKLIHDICLFYKVPLFIDGARMSYGITSSEADLTLADIAELCEVFYIGGTKVGAMFGEAIVFTKNNMPPHFMTQAKQRGALLAKGRLLGLQFETLFTNDLYLRVGYHANAMKDRMVSILKDAGMEFFYETPTNQQFILIEDTRLKQLTEQVAVSYWERYDETRSVVRFATSWATTDSDLDQLEQILKTI